MRKNKQPINILYSEEEINGVKKYAFSVTNILTEIVFCLRIEIEIFLAQIQNIFLP